MTEILITFSNDETVIISKYSLVKKIVKSYLDRNFLITGFRCSSASDFLRLQSKIEETQLTYRGK